MKFIRIEQYNDKKIHDIYEFTGGIEKGQIFRKQSGTCTRLFSRILRKAIVEGDYVVITKGGKDE